MYAPSPANQWRVRLPQVPAAGPHHGRHGRRFAIRPRSPEAEINWRYAKCDRHAAPESFGSFAELVGLWQARAPGDGGLPGRTDFDVFDFKHWLGRIFIARIEREPFNLRFSLWGTQLTDWWGVDYTNKTLGSASNDPEALRAAELAYFKEMDREPFIGVACGVLDQHDRSFIKVIGLDLPLLDDGNLTQVLSAHMEIHPEQDILDVLPDCPILHTF